MSGEGRRCVRAAVLGSPIGHSLSPVLHSAAYVALGLTWWRYEAIECDESGLAALLDSCGPDWAGLSLTMPLKRTVLPLLDRIEPLVTEVGGANTIVFAAAQRFGYNTDVPGMVRALADHGVGTGAGEQSGAGRGGLPVSGAGRSGLPASGAGRGGLPVSGAGPALILGGGATGCAALAALRDLGERSVTVAVRDPARAVELRRAADRLGVGVNLVPFERADFGGARLLISTVPAGAADALAGQLATTMTPPQVVLDVIYHPWPTRLAVAARRAGSMLVGGFDLLLHQAALQVELMTGRPAPLAEMRRAGRTELTRRAG
ncbi:MAG TPA: shikimate dehydrogenase [Streptosporangiaceae bacterium]|nr:shikimate dehydrogenase [Streptosporangiaceae bacterium]